MLEYCVGVMLGSPIVTWKMEEARWCARHSR
jgi:hypothetical protein